jgi:hypothetical protein
MDNLILSPAPPTAPGSPERTPYAPPAVVYEAPLEVRAGTCIIGDPGCPSDPLDLFGTNEN